MIYLAALVAGVEALGLFIQPYANRTNVSVSDVLVCAVGGVDQDSLLRASCTPPSQS